MFNSLKQKFRNIYIMLVACVVVVGAASIVTLHTMAVNVEAMVEQNYKKIQAVDQMLEIIDRQDSAILTYLGVDKEKGINLFTEGMQLFLNWLYVLQDNNSIYEEQQKVERIKTEYDKYCKEFSLLQEEAGENGYHSAVAYYKANMTKIFGELKNDIRQMRDYNINEMINKKESVTRSASGLAGFLFMITMFVAGLAYFFSSKRVESLLRPLYRLCDNIKLISAGESFNTVHCTKSDDTDEIVELETEFNNMVSRLSSYEKSNVGKLMAEKEKLDSIMENIDDALILVNDKMQIETLNPAAKRLFQIGDQKAEGKHVLETLKDREFFDILTLLSAKDGIREQRIILCPDAEGSTEQVCNVVATKIQDYQGGEEADKYTLLIQDITEITKTEKIRTDFIATASHELKTPLTTILMGASMLSTLDFGPLNPEQTEVVGAIKNDVERISGMVEDLVELSKLQSGEVSYHFDTVFLIDVVGEIVEQFAERSHFSGVKLINKVCDDMPAVLADKEKLSWVFNNILNNAFQYTKQGDQIIVSALVKEDKNINNKNKNKNNFLEITISDTGLGIPKENLDLIFENGFHFNESNVESRGSGIGLCLAHKIIKAHGGKIRAESNEGEGTSLIFELPIKIF